MANWFTSIFSSGASTLVDSVGSAIDNLVTSDEERLKLKNELSGQINNFKTEQMKHVTSLEEQISDRHAADMKSDSWLSKNVRPLTLVFLTTATVILAYVTTFSDLTTLQVETLKGWLPLLQVLLVTAFSFYFGGRSIEKFMGRKGK